MTEPKKRGRPKGSYSKARTTTDALEKTQKLLMGALPGIVQETIDKALAGDINAMKIIWDRCVPTRKAIEHTQKLNGAKDMPQVNIIIAPTAEGAKAEDKVIEVKPETIPVLVGPEDGEAN